MIHADNCTKEELKNHCCDSINRMCFSLYRLRVTSLHDLHSLGHFLLELVRRSCVGYKSTVLTPQNLPQEPN